MCANRLGMQFRALGLDYRNEAIVHILATRELHNEIPVVRIHQGSGWTTAALLESDDEQPNHNHNNTNHDHPMHNDEDTSGTTTTPLSVSGHASAATTTDHGIPLLSCSDDDNNNVRHNDWNKDDASGGTSTITLVPSQSSATTTKGGVLVSSCSHLSGGGGSNGKDHDLFSSSCNNSNCTRQSLRGPVTLSFHQQPTSSDNSNNMGIPETAHSIFLFWKNKYSMNAPKLLTNEPWNEGIRSRLFSLYHSPPRLNLVLVSSFRNELFREHRYTTTNSLEPYALRHAMMIKIESANAAKAWNRAERGGAQPSQSCDWPRIVAQNTFGGHSCSTPRVTFSIDHNLTTKPLPETTLVLYSQAVVPYVAWLPIRNDGGGSCPPQQNNQISSNNVVATPFSTQLAKARPKTTTKLIKPMGLKEQGQHPGPSLAKSENGTESISDGLCFSGSQGEILDPSPDTENKAGGGLGSQMAEKLFGQNQVDQKTTAIPLNPQSSSKRRPGYNNMFGSSHCTSFDTCNDQQTKETIGIAKFARRRIEMDDAEDEAQIKLEAAEPGVLYSKRRKLEVLNTLSTMPKAETMKQTVQSRLDGGYQVASIFPENDGVPLLRKSNDGGIRRFQKSRRQAKEQSADDDVVLPSCLTKTANLPASSSKHKMMSNEDQLGKRKRKEEKQERKAKKREKRARKEKQRQEKLSRKEGNDDVEDNDDDITTHHNQHRETTMLSSSIKSSVQGTRNNQRARSTKVDDEIHIARSSLGKKKEEPSSISVLRGLVTSQSASSSIRLDRSVALKKHDNINTNDGGGRQGVITSAHRQTSTTCGGARSKAPGNTTAPTRPVPLDGTDRKNIINTTTKTAVLMHQHSGMMMKPQLPKTLNGHSVVRKFSATIDLTIHDSQLDIDDDHGGQGNSWSGPSVPRAAETKLSKTQPIAGNETRRNDNQGNDPSNLMGTSDWNAQQRRWWQGYPSANHQQNAPTDISVNHSTEALRAKGNHCPEHSSQSEMYATLSQGMAWSTRTAQFSAPIFNVSDDGAMAKEEEWRSYPNAHDHSRATLDQSRQLARSLVRETQPKLHVHHSYVHGRPQQHPFLGSNNSVVDLPNSAVDLLSNGIRIPFPSKPTNEIDPLDIHESSTPTTVDQIKILCAERFLEQWGQVVAKLSSGKWSDSRPMSPGGMIDPTTPSSANSTSIVVEDSPLVDQCNVDLELPGRCAIVVVSTSSLHKEEEAKRIVLRTASLYSLSRFIHLYVILVLDTRTTSSIAQGMLQLQSSIVSIGSGEASQIHFKTTLPQSLAGSIGEIVMGCAMVVQHRKNEFLLDILLDDQAVERAWFLLNLIPTLCVYGVLEILQRAKVFATERSSDTTFGLLFSDDGLRQRIMFAATSSSGNIHPQAMVQLSDILRAPIGSSTTMG